MKAHGAFDPFVVTEKDYRAFFKLPAMYYDPAAAGKEREFIFMEMPRAGIRYHAISKITRVDDAYLHEFTFYRTFQWKGEVRTAHFLSMTSLHIQVPYGPPGDKDYHRAPDENETAPCVIIEAIDVGKGEVSMSSELRTAATPDCPREVTFRRAAYRSEVFHTAREDLGEKPEETKIKDMPDNWSAWMERLCDDPGCVLNYKYTARISPPDVPSKDRARPLTKWWDQERRRTDGYLVELKEVPRAYHRLEPSRSLKGIMRRLGPGVYNVS